MISQKWCPQNLYSKFEIPKLRCNRNLATPIEQYKTRIQSLYRFFLPISVDLSDCSRQKIVQSLLWERSYCSYLITVREYSIIVMPKKLHRSLFTCTFIVHNTLCTTAYFACKLKYIYPLPEQKNHGTNFCSLRKKLS